MSAPDYSFRYASAWALMLFGSFAVSASPMSAAGPQRSPISMELKVAVGHSQVTPGESPRITETLETLLAQDLGQQLGMPVREQQAGNRDPASLPNAENVDAVLTVLPETTPLSPTWERIHTGYAVAAMAIMRSDTQIRNWKQLKGKTACLARDGRYAGMPAGQIGARELLFDSIADALLGLRTGKCDAVVHDDLVLERLLALPEWKKFSARLSAQGSTPLMLLVPRKHGMAKGFSKAAEQWRATRGNDERLGRMVNHIAFEVYLKQAVPDCH